MAGIIWLTYIIDKKLNPILMFNLGELYRLKGENYTHGTIAYIG
jgi:hypothetical protein